MEKTIKQIADDIGIDKQRVYRYIKKNHINEAHQKSGVMYFNEAVQSQIKQAFCQNEVHQRSTSRSTSNDVVDVLKKQTEMLQKELEVKNKQIEDLNERLAENQNLLNQAQQLQAVAETKLKMIEAKEEPIEEKEEPEEENKKSWFGKWFR